MFSGLIPQGIAYVQMLHPFSALILYPRQTYYIPCSIKSTAGWVGGGRVQQLCLCWPPDISRVLTMMETRRPPRSIWIVYKNHPRRPLLLRSLLPAFLEALALFCSPPHPQFSLLLLDNGEFRLSRHLPTTESLRNWARHLPKEFRHGGSFHFQPRFLLLLPSLHHSLALF